MGRLARLLPAIWLVALLAAPAVAWLLGERQPLLQNQPKKPFPTINRSSLQDRATFDQLDDALLDRFPFRGAALEARAAIAYDVFGESTNPDVIVGSNGWLYYRPELMPCTPGSEPATDPADTVDVLARTLVAAGYRTTVVIAAAKQFIHDDPASSVDARAEECVRAMVSRIDRRLARTPGGLALTPELLALERAGKSPFLKRDTHWNWRGREVFARRVLDRVQPGLVDEIGLRPGPAIRYPGDLVRMMGMRRTEPDRAVIALRPPRRPLAPGEVVLIGDSQLDVSLKHQLSPRHPALLDIALVGQLRCDWADFLHGGCDDAIRRARVLVIEKVIRDIHSVTFACWRPIAIAGERLRGPAAKWEPLEGAGTGADGALEIPPSGSIAVRVRSRGADVSDVPRVLRLPVERYGDSAVPVTMTQETPGGQAAPCATPDQGAAGGALMLPIPAGRPMSDFVLRLTSAPGTRLGRPQEIVLDGRALVRRG